MKIRTSISDFNVEYFFKNHVFDNDTKNRIYDWNEFFRSKLITKLNELYEDNWKLDFTQKTEKSWLVDIQANDIAIIKSIKSIIIQSLEDFEIEAFCNNRAI